MSVSNETKDFLAEITWYFINYPIIKERADSIAKQIEKLETQKPKKEQSV